MMDEEKNIVVPPPSYANGGIIASTYGSGSSTSIGVNTGAPYYIPHAQPTIATQMDPETRARLENVERALQRVETIELGNSRTLSDVQGRLSELSGDVKDVNESIRDGGHPKIGYLEEQVLAWTEQAEEAKAKDTERLRLINSYLNTGNLSADTRLILEHIRDSII
jgi:hypothetical protein